MQSIINSILKNRNLIIYIILSLVTFNSLYTNSSVHYSGIEKTATYLSGKSSIFSSYIYSYFNLRNKNQILIEENLQLKKIEYKNNYSSQNLENNSLESKPLNTANIILNSINKSKNIIVIDKGILGGIMKKWGL